MIPVIIVEDIADYRNGIVAMLNLTDGFTCIGAYESGEAALLYEPELNSANVALIDIGLPGINGIELVRTLKIKNPNLLCLMCTSIDEDQKVFEALEAGAFGYILKSSSIDKLLDAIQELYNGGSPMSSEIARKVMLHLHKQNTTAPKENFKLTPKEIEVLQYLSKGLLYKEIAQLQQVTIDTIKKHCFNIYEKMHVSNRTEAVNKFEGR
jgi:two-component system, NarL family, response regulator LiaR